MAIAISEEGAEVKNDPDFDPFAFVAVSIIRPQIMATPYLLFEKQSWP